MSAKNALVVDDTPANLDFLVRLLQQAGFDVQPASTGQEARKIAEATPHLPLAVIDMQLPDMSGLDLTRSIRSAFPDAYIVVASMHDQRSLMEKVFQRGGNCYLVKPHGFMELYKRLTTIDLMELRQSAYTIIDQYGPRSHQMTASGS